MADFSGDGIPDVLLPGERALLGLRVAPGAGSLVIKLLYAFFGLAVVLAAGLRYGQILDVAEPRGNREDRSKTL